MERLKHRIELIAVAGLIVLAACNAGCDSRNNSKPINTEQPDKTLISIDYPEEGAIFPPDMIAPLFSWHDSAMNAKTWRIDVAFSDGSAQIHTGSDGASPQVGEIDPRCISDTNKRPDLTPSRATAHTWRPSEAIWAAVRKHAVEEPATITITGLSDAGRIVSMGSITLTVSRDPVGAPIFYRDVPLMPAETEKGSIRPLAQKAVPLIAWRLRNIGEPQSMLVLTNMHSCANCHSFTRDGKTLCMDLDGILQNSKSLYAITSLEPQTFIRQENVISWRSLAGGAGILDQAGDRKGTGLRLGFMSQVSPDGRYVVTTLNSQIYAVNFLKHYEFLQVFYPTRGVLAWYDRVTGKVGTLPGAEDVQYVQTGAFWSPDSKYLVFSRAKAREAYPEGRPLPEYANDPNELPVQYDLCRIPFNGGKGGKVELIAEASGNKKSNAFPKVSPDGKWIVFVQSQNGFLQRPDSQLFIMPASGGPARRMRCNLALMNSWHSFSPNSRWMVFSSKAWSPYTQLFLTHIDENGQDSPAILIENCTAANRAVNIPEFINIPADGLKKISVPAAEQYRLLNEAVEYLRNNQTDQAIKAFEQALVIDPNYAEAHNNLGVTLWRLGRVNEAIAHYEQAMRVKPNEPEAHRNLGAIFLQSGKLTEAIAQYEEALRIGPNDPVAHNDMGVAMVHAGRLDKAVEHYKRALQVNPDNAEAHNNFGVALWRLGRLSEAVTQYEQAVRIKPDEPEVHSNFGALLLQAGNLKEAIAQYQEVLRIRPNDPVAHNDIGVAFMHSDQPEQAFKHYQQAIQIKTNYAEAYNNLGSALQQTGKLPEAVAHFEQALRLKPSFAQAHYNLGLVLAKTGHTNAAIEHYEQALKLQPADLMSHDNLGELLAATGKRTLAANHYSAALQIEPDFISALNHLAWLRATDEDPKLRNGAEAVKLAERACQLTGRKQAGSLDILAAAYAETGRFKDAEAAAQEALKLVPSSDDITSSQINSRLELYQAGRPCRTVTTK